MFSVVGLIGMTGIIINDSSGLITTIDQYSEERGLFPAIVDGVADRLRPVMLTTLTTVLGLAPLLFESSSQAQFLKPTVITLVYGLGFGMGLVLLVVPALIAIQSDTSRQIAALKRALKFPSGGRIASVSTVVSALLIAVIFAATLGAAAVGGSVPAPLVELFPSRAEAPLMVTAFGLFFAAVLSVVTVVYAIGSLTLAWQQSKTI
jgi:predicted RND superfamily exporter protein